MSDRAAIKIAAPNSDHAALYAGILRRSITELCAADHRNDPEKLAPWLSNKTTDQVRAWIARGDMIIRVAVLGGQPAGFALATRAGDIRLNYVAPEARFQSVSTALLADLENELCALGIIDARLTSTETAHAFYQSRGWRDDGAPEIDNGMTGYPMTKRLSAQ